MTARSIITGAQAASSYFRTTVDHPHRKDLVQVCEPCHMLCSHCFVNATKRGTFMSVAQITDRLIPALKSARVTRVTVTGGEPFVHEDLIEIVAELRAAGFGVGVCTNGTGVSDEDIRALAVLDAHVNVSLDGFSEDSHVEGQFMTSRSTCDVLTFNLNTPSRGRAERQFGYLAARPEPVLVLTETANSEGCRFLAERFTAAGTR